MSREVLYLHGFASSPDGAKATALAARLAPDVVLIRPDLNVPSFRHLDFEQIVEHAHAAAMSREPAAIVGSSLGSLVALALIERGLRLPLILIAPALGISERWREKTPAGDPIIAFHHGVGSDLPIHRAFFEQMMGVSIDESAPPVPVIAFMGRLDETVPVASVEGRWNEWRLSGRLSDGSRLILLDEGDHGLVAFVPEIAAEIRRVVMA